MFYKKLMTWLILITILITISSNFWFIFWLMMEMNMMMFIPIMKSNKINSCNAMITYFIIQSFSSTLFFLSSTLSFLNESIMFIYMMNISILIKLALVPFHFWLTMISENLDSLSLFLMLTIQKIIPLFILLSIKSNLILTFGLISSIFGSTMALNSKFLKKILIFSSISHLGWLVILIYSESNFWISYLLIYSLIIYKILKLINKNNLTLISNFFFKKMLLSEKISFICLMMSLSGMPPFIGFFIKLMAIMIIVKITKIIMIILIISSLMNIYFYMRLIIPTLISFNQFLKNMKSAKMFKSSMINMNVIFTVILFNLMI
uniref:NADH-ubiquinone oxidoreductase chain 2 n=1 Tax=Haemaphysalis colasbelcouri TaxID=2926932 RepID=A0A976MY96_9ACAR|nr:NADH dehydrogenase subunit 2 [Haemaphysalis colasbelcouri]UNO54001.1 NADH dehydrogenase subunit 2 [Haemaphysalis colasbelcouri]